MHPADDDAINTDEKIWDLTQAINVKGGKLPFLSQSDVHLEFTAKLAAY